MFDVNVKKKFICYLEMWVIGIINWGVNCREERGGIMDLFKGKKEKEEERYSLDFISCFLCRIVGRIESWWEMFFI